MYQTDALNQLSYIPIYLVGRVGIEPTWPDFQSGALTNFATSPFGYQYVKELYKDKTKNPNLVSSGVYFFK